MGIKITDQLPKFKDITPQCKGCGKLPAELKEAQIGARVERCSPAEFIRREEGTYNPETGAFYCTTCYITAGMPLGKA